jgi:hypothetical protein
MCVFNAERLKMDEKTQIPYIVYETEMTRSERNFKRLWVVVIILISLLVTTNLCWLAYESQFETVESTEINAEQDGSGVNIVGAGDVDYGAEN